MVWRVAKKAWRYDCHVFLSRCLDGGFRARTSGRIHRTVSFIPEAKSSILPPASRRTTDWIAVFLSSLWLRCIGLKCNSRDCLSLVRCEHQPFYLVVFFRRGNGILYAIVAHCFRGSSNGNCGWFERAVFILSSFFCLFFFSFLHVEVNCRCVWRYLEWKITTRVRSVREGNCEDFVILYIR